mmetsp:Transcript_24805/g.27605  ORF Transcript_24805/g.27605 Transcript_24805/m.27605 type:complete len:181 (-) Transcript_24805:161-703(-)
MSETDLLGGTQPTEEIIEEEFQEPESTDAPAVSEADLLGAEDEIIEEEIADTSAAAAIPAQTAPSANNGISQAYTDWQAKHKQNLEAKKAKTLQREEKAKAEAKAELDSIYAERDAMIASRKKKNRAEQDVVAGSTEEQNIKGTDWQRIGNMVDLQNPSSKSDVSRMKELLIRMKNPPKA